MSGTNVQFSVAAHVMAALGAAAGEGVRSAELAGSVNAEPSFVRRVVSKLAKAGLVATTRGRGGTCTLARPASQITMLDIYQASESPSVCAVHEYPVEPSCRVSRNIKASLRGVLGKAQAEFEDALAEQTLEQLVAKVKSGR